MHSLTLIITEKCNSQCKYCYESNKRAQGLKRDMVLDDFITGFSKILKYVGVIGTIQFFGGEATLKVDLIKQIDEYLDKVVEAKIYKKKPTYAFSINLLELPDSFKKLLKKLQEGGHDFYISTSIDGDQKIHDANRLAKGIDSPYLRIVKNYKTLKSMGIDLKAITCVFNQVHLERNISILDNILHLSKEFQPERITVLSAQKSPGLEVELSYFYQLYLDAVHSAFNKIICKKPDYKFVGPFLKGIVFKWIYLEDKDVAFYACPTKIRDFTIFPQGGLSNCPDEFYQGFDYKINVYDENFQDEIHNFIDMNKHNLYKDHLRIQCKECKIKKLCTYCPHYSELYETFCKFNISLVHNVFEKINILIENGEYEFFADLLGLKDYEKRKLIEIFNKYKKDVI
ncbi:hypothetical protein BBF96_10130 [Anoxybacter fermentans]|uniref:Radical SAM core domain-containing protein n=1 Tax=Anoxybacter fermentans TaxID=1323375 RepID=A0A3Q9HQZ7_9FIRM|nr:radical SAM protein [Anoxybacter fermentans]AZR73709.1 hypothetical protein BBF96_10130 [Anoxybacter fermentans]